MNLKGSVNIFGRTISAIALIAMLGAGAALTGGVITGYLFLTGQTHLTVAEGLSVLFAVSADETPCSELTAYTEGIPDLGTQHAGANVTICAKVTNEDGNGLAWGYQMTPTNSTYSDAYMTLTEIDGTDYLLDSGQTTYLAVDYYIHNDAPPVDDITFDWAFYRGE